MVYNKVVRDKVVAIMSNKGMHPETTMLTAKAFLESLKAKLLEECKEFLQAKEHKDKVEELADMMEVALAIMKRENITMDQVLKKRFEKLEAKGGFEDEYFLANDGCAAKKEHARVDGKKVKVKVT